MMFTTIARRNSLSPGPIVLCWKLRVLRQDSGFSPWSCIRRNYASTRKSGEPHTERSYRQGREDRKLLTLQPHRFAGLGQQAHDLSGYKWPRFLTPAPFNSLPTTVTYYLRQRYPPKTKGYLYFNRLTDIAPPFDCDIRFRVCEDHSTFKEGHDLQQPSVHGTLEPWSLSLLRVFGPEKQGYVKGLRHLMLEEKLVDSDVASHISRYPCCSTIDNVLHALDQPFLVNLGSHSPIALALMTRHIFAHFWLPKIFGERRRPMRTCRFPYTGLARVRFERSTLPEDAECPAYFLKFLEFLKPIECVIPNYDYHIQNPAVGEYLTKFETGNGYTRWKFRPTQNLGARELGEAINSPLHRDYFNLPPPTAPRNNDL